MSANEIPLASLLAYQLWHVSPTMRLGGRPRSPGSPPLVCYQPVVDQATPRVLTRRRLRHRLAGGTACVAARRGAWILLGIRRRVRGWRVGQAWAARRRTPPS